jgi:tetratricopeptide (TPR) repeat protein
LPPVKPSAKVEELMNMGFTQKQAENALEMFDNNVERAANYLFDAPPKEEEVDAVASSPRLPTAINYDDAHDDKEEEEEESVDPQFWKQKAQEYQQMALKAKKDGDKKKAVALLRESKNYNQKYQDLLEIHPPAEEQVSAEIPTPSTQEVELAPPSPVAAPPIPSPVLDKRVETTTHNLQQAQNLLAQVISLQKQYKEAAIHYKGLGNLAAAKQMVRISKDLLHTGIKLKNGEIADLSVLKLPEAPDMTLGDGKIRQVQEYTSGNQLTSLEQIEHQLQYQINICHNLSIQHSPTISRRKTTLADNTQGSGNVYAQVEKALSADLVSLHATKPGIPSLHYEQVNYTYKNVLDTIPDNMMEFKILRASSLPTLNIATNLDPFVAWDFGGWPPENTAQAAMNKGETPVVSGINPEFDFTMHIPISRTNRLFQRYVQRKKLTVEVFHNKYTYGLFRRPVSLGKVVLPMDRLLTKTSISGIFDLLDASRKKTGGKIELQVNLREPLMGEDMAKRSERWLVIDAFGGTVSQCLSMAGLTVGGPYVPSPSIAQLSDSSAPSTPVIPAVESSPSSVAKAPEKQQPSTALEHPTKQPESTETDVKMGESELELAEEEFNR